MTCAIRGEMLGIDIDGGGWSEYISRSQPSPSQRESPGIDVSFMTFRRIQPWTHVYLKLLAQSTMRK